MDPNSRLLALGAGSGVETDPVYVEDVFSTYLYEGTGAAQTITNGIDLSGKGGMVLQRRRSTGYWFLNDTENGADNFLYTNFTNALAVGTSGSSFNSNGFTIGTENNLHNTGDDVVSWTFRKQAGFFDVVTYTGNGTSGHTISHGLGSTPGMIWIKSTSNNENWQVWHRSVTGNLELDNTGAVNSSSIRITAVSSTDFTLASFNTSNGNGQTYVAYVFAHDAQIFGANKNESIIKCGSYSSTGFVDLGFEPQWVMIKSTDNTSAYTGDWRIFDNMRGIVAGDDAQLFANESRAEDAASFATAISLNATGFTVEGQGNYGTSTIYMAIRRPHKPPEAGTDVFAMDTLGGTSPNPPAFNAGFPVDWAFYKNKNSSTSNWALSTRLTAKKVLNTNNAGAEAVDTDSAFDFDYQDGIGDSTSTSSNVLSWLFRRAPGCFDVVTYTGTGASTPSQSHSLGVKPEFKIIKRRDGTGDWVAGGEVMDERDSYVYLNTADGKVDSSNYWNAVDTANTFSVRANNGNSGGSGMNYIAFLFATVAGVSKVGTYAGTGNNINVDCGFSSGARLVIIKRLDGNGSWRVFDTDQGINAGNDPYLLLNRTDAQTSADHIDPLSTGFTITSGAPAALNTNGGSYLFLAFA